MFSLTGGILALWQSGGRYLIEQGIAGQAARILASCALAYAGARMLGLAEGYWALITAVVVMQPGLAETLAAGRNRLAGTLIGAATGLAVTEAARHGAPMPAMFWLAMVPLAVLTAYRPYLRLSCITLIVVVLVPSAGGGVFARPLGRIVEILLGTVASIVVSVVTQKIAAAKRSQ